MNDKPLHEPTGQPAENTYRTGDTDPPKSRKGIFAFLLGTVIFVSGLVTILGKMNIHLAQTLIDQQEPEMCTVSFAPVAYEDSRSAGIAPLGFFGQAVPPFWQDYEALPQGVYITNVEQACEAATAGIRPGDILLTVNGHPVSSWEAFARVLGEKSPGERIHVTVYRQGNHFEYSLTLRES